MERKFKIKTIYIIKEEDSETIHRAFDDLHEAIKLAAELNEYTDMGYDRFVVVQIPFQYDYSFVLPNEFIKYKKSNNELH